MFIERRSTEEMKLSKAQIHVVDALAKQKLSTNRVLFTWGIST